MPVVGVDDGEATRPEQFPDVSNVGECRILRAHENRSHIQRNHRVPPLLGEQRDCTRSDAECEERELFNQQTKGPPCRKASQGPVVEQQQYKWQ